MKSRFICYALPVCPSCFGAGTPIDILHRTAAAYRNLRSFEFGVTVQDVRDGKVSQRSFIESGSGAGRYRVEDQDRHGETRIADGHIQWIINPASNEYAKVPLAESDSPIYPFEQIDQHVTSAEIAREEQFNADGKPVPVYVVRVVRDQWPSGSLDGIQFAMYRIDQRTSAIYKVASYSPDTVRMVLYSIHKWNQPVPEERFAFTPPDSARVAASVAAPVIEPASLTGTQAADFTLNDTNGHPVHLRDLRGKVVVVDFWATWCPPCRALMPHLEDLHHRLSDRGLVVLGLDIGEDQKTVTHFAKSKSYTFTLLLGAEPDVSALYYVQAYPTTFVIDRQGRIVFTGLGGESPDKLQAAVEKALEAGT